MSVAQLSLRPIEIPAVLKDRIYESLKRAIVGLDPYQGEGPRRLDERQLAEELGVSRTPVREALCRLENEGFVHTLPRRGVFVTRKSKAEILEMLTVWAALEGMAARLVTQRAADRELAKLRRLFATFDDGEVQANIDEYSETNIAFHQEMFRLSRCHLLGTITENLFLHMRSIRRRTIGDDDRAERSIIDHIHIIEALEARDAELAERLAREHTLNLARHVEEHVDWLD